EIGVRRDAAAREDRAAFLASDARTREVRAKAAALVRQASGDQNYSDANYVFPTFIITQMPVGLVGLMIAAIFVAAMSASGGELNSLATATIIDFYRRYLVTAASDEHYVRVSKVATMFWGLFAGVVAMRAAAQGSLIEVVNRYGSVVFGSLLRRVLLAILTKRPARPGAVLGRRSSLAGV